MMTRERHCAQPMPLCTMPKLMAAIALYRGGLVPLEIRLFIMSGRGDDFHALGKQWAEGRTGLEACIPALRLLRPCTVNAAQIIRNSNMHRRSHVREAQVRAAHPATMVEQVAPIRTELGHGGEGVGRGWRSWGM